MRWPEGETQERLIHLLMGDEDLFAGQFSEAVQREFTRRLTETTSKMSTQRPKARRPTSAGPSTRPRLTWYSGRSRGKTLPPADRLNRGHRPTPPRFRQGQSSSWKAQSSTHPADTDSAKQVPQGSLRFQWGIDQSVIRKGHSAHTADPACAQQLSSKAKTWLQLLGLMLQVADEASQSTSINLLSQRVQPWGTSPYISVLDPQHLLWWATPRNWAKGRPFHQHRLLTSISLDMRSKIYLHTFYLHSILQRLQDS